MATTSATRVDGGVNVRVVGVVVGEVDWSLYRWTTTCCLMSVRGGATTDLSVCSFDCSVGW